MTPPLPTRLPREDSQRTSASTFADIGPEATVAASCDAFEVDPASGLAHDEAARRRDLVGPNRLLEPPQRPAWRRFTDQFRSVLVLILAGAALLAAAVGDYKDAVVVAVVLLVNATLGYVQEGRAESAMAALRQMLSAQARVRRDGVVQEVPADDLVPGDIVLLEAGDRVPADGRVVFAASLAVDESSLTGESVPVEKTAEAVPSSPTGERPNRGFMNTTVVRGRAELLVTATGMATEMGRVAGLLQEATDGPTPLQTQLDRLGKRLAVVAAVAVALVFVTRLAQGQALSEAALGAVALAVAAIPEGLPAVVTVTLAVGVHQMALRRAIVKRLASVETLGSTTVICSDKTGTLTLNEMTVRRLVHDRSDYDLPDRTDRDDATDPALPAGVIDALEHSVLCNEASISTDGAIVGDPTEVALVACAVDAGVDVSALRDRAPRVGEVPFDSSAKFMATFHRFGPDVLCVVKGAPDVVLDRCSSAAGADGPSLLDGDARRRWVDGNEVLAGQGMRVLAVASRWLPAADAVDQTGGVADPDAWVDSLTMEMLIGIIDPPRPEARDAVERCRQAGVSVKMITGDHATTAGAIAAQLGIDGRVVTGVELDRMSPEELERSIDQIGVCARVSPEHKVRVVQALRRRDHIVAMTGDGVNDAAALRHADIGVAMGITGTQVTKEAADMVLVDDNFATIVSAVERGRAIRDNIVKFVRFQLTTNLAAIGALLGAGLLGLPAPLSAIQVLFVNIIADGPPAMTLGVDPPAPGTMQRPPLPPGSPILDRRRILRLLWPAAVMVVGTLGLLVGAEAVWDEDVALTMAFTTFVTFQLFNVFNARTESGTIWSRESLANGKLWAAVGVVALLQVLIVHLGPLQRLFDTTALTAGQWFVCVAVAATVLAAEEVRKVGSRRPDRSGSGHDPRARALERQTSVGEVFEAGPEHGVE